MTTLQLWPRALRLLAAMAACALAQPDIGAAGAIRIADAWARATPPGAVNGAAYCRIVNEGGADRLLGARSTAARAVEVHVTDSTNGVLEMRGVGSLPVAAGATVELGPGGTHLMLIGIAAALTAGTTIQLTLVFENAGEVGVSVPIVDARAAVPSSAGPEQHAH